MKQRVITAENQSTLRDESGLAGNAEQLFWPESREEAVQLIRCAAQKGEKLTFRGAATGLMGGAVPMGGWLVDLSRLKQMGQIANAWEEGVYTLQADCGVTLEEIEKKAAAQGLFFPPDPTEKNAALGGMFATGAGGPTQMLYGPCSRWVRELEWVTPQGEKWSIHRGDYTAAHGQMPLPGGGAAALPPQHSGLGRFWEGMDLIDLLAGTEGWLGAALSLTLTLLPQPADLWGVVFFFEAEQAAMAFAQTLLPLKEQRVQTARLAAAEYYDAGALQLLRQASGAQRPAGLPPLPGQAQAALYVELHASQEGAAVELLMQLLESFAACGGKEEDTWSENGPAVQRFREMRHAVPLILSESPQLRDPRTGLRWETDCQGPAERFAQSLETAHSLCQKYGVPGVVYGHLLENHLCLALLPGVEQQEACAALVREAAADTVRQKGRIAAGYGVGHAKRALVQQLLPIDQRQALAALRDAFDPQHRMNP